MPPDCFRNTPAYAGKTDDLIDFRLPGGGNTPAYAGKTCKDVPISRVGEKHPRLRGEDVFLLYPDGKGLETPPLTRGRQHLFSKVPATDRNTPAYAGKTTK